MESADKYHELKLEIARAAAAEQHPSLEGFCRAFTEEFGHSPPDELIDYFNARRAELDRGTQDEDSCAESQIEWCMESSDNDNHEDSAEARADGSGPVSGSGAAKENQGAGLALPADFPERAVLKALLCSQHSEAVAITDARGSVVHLNPAAEALLGEKLEQLKGNRSLLNFFHWPEERFRTDNRNPGDGAGETMISRLAAETDDPTASHGVTATLTSKDGQPHTVRMALTPLALSDGTLWGYLAAIHDQTEAGRIQAQLGSCLDDQRMHELDRLSVLEQLTRLIRTPLTAILGFCNLLEDSDLDESSAAYVKKIGYSVDRLISGMSDFIDLYRIQDGELDLVPVEFDLREVAAKATDSVMPRLGAKPVNLDWHLADPKPPRLWGDARRLRQVLTALLGNAVKYTAQGDISLEMEVKELEAENVQLKVTVRDTGKGIPSEKLARIFKIPRSAAVKEGGQGRPQDLNLFVCRHIARRMGGDLRVNSPACGGSVFDLEIRLSRADSDLRQGSRVALDGQRLFVSTGHSAEALALQGMLDDAQLETQRFDTPKKMFAELFAAIERGAAPRLCLCEITAPDWKASKAAKNFQLARVLYPQLRLIGIASPEVWESKDKLAPLFDAVLTYPLDNDHLLAMLNKVAGPLPETPSADEQPAADLRILVAEDEPFHFDLLQEIFNRAGHTVTRAKSGLDLINTYLAQPDQFDIIFTDLEMPELDGRQAVCQIRDAGYTQIPIVAISSQLEAHERDRCLTSGLDDFIAKPFRREVLLAMLDKFFG